MNNQLTTTNNDVIQKLVLDGDISKMSGDQKVSYYNSFCGSLGLNPLTQPFQIINFQGKQRLYATKDCTEQLRKLHGVSITEVSTQELRGVFVVTAKAKDSHGRTDASTGAVNIEGLKGDMLANALMKAETKAKRRVTLSICGLGILDETEVETMKGAVTEDADFSNIPDKDELDILRQMVGNSTLTTEQKVKAYESIDTCKDFKKYDQIKYRLEDCQMGFDDVQNPSQKDITHKLKKLA